MTPPDIDTQIESLLNRYSSKQATFNSKLWEPRQKRQAEREWQSIQAEAHKAIKTLLIQSKSIDVGALFDICDEFATVQAENGEDYMMKWFYRNQDRFLAKLKEEL